MRDFVLFLTLLWASAPSATKPVFHGVQAALPEGVAARVRQFSWRAGCPISVADLAYLRLDYHGYDGALHEGELMVHKDLAREVLAIFQALFEQGFSIEKMRLVDAYQGDDDASMADNNTSGFNCRFVAGKPGVFSKHSFGRAIDINPRTNPMVRGAEVDPPAGAPFLDRRQNAAGMLLPEGGPVREFLRRGWLWGGNWISMKDYQHFEK